jgi:hypothetical protein
MGGAVHRIASIDYPAIDVAEPERLLAPARSASRRIPDAGNSRQKF